MFGWEFLHLLCYMVAVVFLLFIVVVLAFFLAPMSASRDKTAPYECGFHPFEDTRKEFSIHFYLIALFFVAFDLEVLLLLPWVINFSELDVWAYWSGSLFLFILFLGFLYEWRTGALTW